MYVQYVCMLMHSLEMRVYVCIYNYKYVYIFVGLLQRVNPYKSLADGGVFELTQVVW